MDSTSKKNNRKDSSNLSSSSRIVSKDLCFLTMGSNWLNLGLTLILAQTFLISTDCRVVDTAEGKFEMLTPQDFRNGLHLNVSDIDPNSPDPVER